MSFDEALRARLLELVERDRATRARLVAAGTLFARYHGKMEAVHAANAGELAQVLDRYGWPGIDLVGEDGGSAAWTIAMHAIGLPDFQRRCLGLLTDAVEASMAPAAFAAMLEDRIRFNERRPQRFGTIFDWDREGRLSPWQIEEPERVDALRREVGLPPLAEQTARARAAPRGKGNEPPASFDARQQEISAWARKTGWLR